MTILRENTGVKNKFSFSGKTYFCPSLWASRRKAFSISTTGMIISASPIAIIYSVRVIGAKENALLRKGTKITAAVISREKTSVPHSHRFYFLRLNREALRERMLKEWKISTMLSVRKAMVMPAGDSAIPQVPLSSLCPIK